MHKHGNLMSSIARQVNELLPQEKLLKAALAAGLKLIVDAMNQRVDDQDKCMCNEVLTNMALRKQLREQGDGDVAVMLEVFGGLVHLWDKAGLTLEARVEYGERFRILFYTVMRDGWSDSQKLEGRICGMSTGLWAALIQNIAVLETFRELHPDERFLERYLGTYDVEGLWSAALAMTAHQGHKPRMSLLGPVLNKVDLLQRYKMNEKRPWQETWSNRQKYDHGKEAERIRSDKVDAWNNGSAVEEEFDQSKEHGKKRRSLVANKHSMHTPSIRSHHAKRESTG